jgi:hypothetical protein
MAPTDEYQWVVETLKLIRRESIFQQRCINRLRRQEISRAQHDASYSKSEQRIINQLRKKP